MAAEPIAVCQRQRSRRGAGIRLMRFGGAVTRRPAYPTLPAMTTRRRAGLIAIAAGLVSGAMAAQAPPPGVSYRFPYAQAGDSTVAVEIGWGSPLAEPRSLVMPRAIPMG